jgi:hypothetical protein
MFETKKQELKAERLRLQLEYLEALRSRHLLWANSTVDPETARLHLEIVNAVGRIREQYVKLIEMVNIYI